MIKASKKQNWQQLIHVSIDSGKAKIWVSQPGKQLPLT